MTESGGICEGVRAKGRCDVDKGTDFWGRMMELPCILIVVVVR